MFPRQRRVHSSEDILTALRHGQKARYGAVTCSYLKKTGTLSRVTVIVSKKSAKLAHDRNRMKRQARALLMMEPLPSGDFVLQLNQAAREQAFSLLEQQIKACLRRFS